MKQAKAVRPRTLGPPGQAGPAQDPWPPKPSRSGPGPLAPQAKPVWPRTRGPPSQAGPAPGPAAVLLLAVTAAKAIPSGMNRP